MSECATARPALPGELCWCGRAAVFVLPMQGRGEVGDCGRSPLRTGPCPFCGGRREDHPGYCPEYRLRPDTVPVQGSLF